MKVHQQMKISPEWTPQERLNIVSALLNLVSDDIYAGKYGLPGRPNITALQHIIHEPAESLEAIRGSLEKMLKQPSDVHADSVPFPDPGFNGGPVS